jgi:hypothetical protein
VPLKKYVMMDFSNFAEYHPHMQTHLCVYAILLPLLSTGPSAFAQKEEQHAVPRARLDKDRL